MDSRDWVELVEYVPKRLDRSRLSMEEGAFLWTHYGDQVAVDSPSFKTAWQWELTSLGWVGYIPLRYDFGLNLVPKVPIGNLFRMLEYAYRLKSFRFLDGLVECSTLKDFYNLIAMNLARRVLDRERKGLYRSYLGIADELPYVSGRMDIRKKMARPWVTKVHCEYQEHSADIEDNQILAWTLYRVVGSGLCSEKVLPVIRRVYHNLKGFATPSPFTSRDCVGRLYNRLNQDYEPMHLLCRFFLDQCGPSYTIGEYSVMPFLVDMARLYELFVAEWLKLHLPARYELRSQERVRIGGLGEIVFAIDLVVYDRRDNVARCVLDTKYKATDTPANDDFNQVVTYAEAKHCTEAVLVYPSSQIRRFDVRFGKSGMRVRAIPFPIAGCIEKAGAEFLARLLDTDAAPYSHCHDYLDSVR